jgi:hypothetical protein
MSWKSVLDWLKNSVLVKNAVNAAVLSLVQMYHDPADNNFHNWHGLKGILWQVGAAVLAREGMIVIPKIIKWSTTNGGTVMKIFLAFALTLCFATASFAQAKPVAKKQKHALVKVLEAPLVVPKVVFTGLKGTLYGVMFTTEVGVDGVRLVSTGADRVFDVLSISGKIPVLDMAYQIVHVVSVDSTKLDGWLERQEDGLFGSHN